MWVHYDLKSDIEKQIQLHKIFRKNILEWSEEDLISGAVLTYHAHDPRAPSDSLYLCLKINNLEVPKERTSLLNEEVLEQIPKQIHELVKKVASENDIRVYYSQESLPADRLVIKDYEFNQIKASKSNKGYYNAPVHEVLKFASTGTKIAIDILTKLENNHTYFSTDRELAQYILDQLYIQLGKNYKWIRESFHFVCNPLLGVIEAELWLSLQNEKYLTHTRSLNRLFRYSTL